MLARYLVVIGVAACGRFGFDSQTSSAQDGSVDGAIVTNGPSYPRLGGMSLSNPQDYDQLAFRVAAAKRHLVVISYYPGWSGARTMSLAEVITDVKARSTIGTKIFVYINDHDEIMDPTASNSFEFPTWQTLNANQWWLYPKGTSGTPVRPPGGNAAYGMPNFSTFNPSVGGATWQSVNADLWFEFSVTGNGTDAPTPNLDGFMVGNVYGTPMADGDWDRDGVTDSAGDPLVRLAVQGGGKRYADYLRTIDPQGIVLAGMYGWRVDLGFGPLDQAFDGGVAGALIGESYSVETNDGFDAMMVQYRADIDATRAPKLYMVTQDKWAAGDYRSMRYGLGATLMDDGYFDINDGLGSLVSDALYFDEFDAALGQPTQPRQDKPWQNGVWRRDFEHGIALVNPKGNGAQTVDLGGSFRHVSGSQDPVTNDGSTTSTVTLADRDGLILLR